MRDLTVPSPLFAAAALKTHARYGVSGDLASAEDDLIAGYIAAATALIEAGTNSVLMQRAVAFEIARPFRAWWFPRRPIVSITSIEIVDLAGDAVELDVSDFSLQSPAETPCLRPVSGFMWPEVDPGAPITVTCTAGVSDDPADIDQRFHLVAMHMAAHLMNNREIMVSGEAAMRVMPYGFHAIMSSLAHDRPREAIWLSC